MSKFLTLLLVISIKIFASDNYYVSPSGNDSNDGLSITTPLLTISEAFLRGEGGSIIYLLPGTYNGKTVLNDIHGNIDLPITITSYSNEENEYAVIDGNSTPGMDLFMNVFELHNCSWINFEKLIIQNSWTDPILVYDSNYLTFSNCSFNGGRRVIYAFGHGTHHILVEHCFWEQDPRVWTEFDWDMMHDGPYNGALLHPWGTAGGHVFRNNKIQNVFNGFRSKPENIQEDANMEIYNNEFTNVADNDFEPERWAWNIHYYHNRLHNIHKAYSIDKVQGGYIYIYGIRYTESSDANAIDKVSGIFKFKNGPLTYPCYVFNNSYYTEARLFKEDESTNNMMKHFNNAYYFFAGSNRFELLRWDDSFEFDNDCSNQNWPVNIITHNQEEHGIVADIKFEDPVNGNLRLATDSPGIDHGKVMSFSELDWTQDYLGNNPDIGAYEGSNLVEGPPFRYRTPPGGDLVLEKPRITRHYLIGNILTLYFSSPISQESINSNSINVFNSSGRLTINSIEMKNDNYRLDINLNSSPNIDSLSLSFNNMPVGENGEQATYWASTIRIHDRDAVTKVEEGNKMKNMPEDYSLNIYPNPTNGEINILVNGKGEKKDYGFVLTLTNIVGQKILSKYYSNTNRVILSNEITKLSSGIYFASVKINGKNSSQIITSKIVLMK